MTKLVPKFGIQIEPQLGFTYQTVEKIALEGENLVMIPFGVVITFSLIINQKSVIVWKLGRF